MENLSTASSRRSSFNDVRPKPQVNPKYRRIFSHQKTLGSRGYNPTERIKKSTDFKHELIQKWITTINGTKWQNGNYCFKVGKQERDERFANVFIPFLREMRGGDFLVNSSANVLADKFFTSPDMCRIYETKTVDEYGIDYSTEIAPTIELINKVKKILEDEHGLQNQFIKALNLFGSYSPQLAA